MYIVCKFGKITFLPWNPLFLFRQEKEQFAGTTRLKHARRGTYNDLRPHEGALQERKEEMDKRRR